MQVNGGFFAPLNLVDARMADQFTLVNPGEINPVFIRAGFMMIFPYFGQPVLARRNLCGIDSHSTKEVFGRLGEVVHHVSIFFLCSKGTDFKFHQPPRTLSVRTAHWLSRRFDISNGSPIPTVPRATWYAQT